MSAETQRLATIITATAQIVDELAREVPFLSLMHDCISGAISVHVRSAADLARLPGKAKVVYGDGGTFNVSKRCGEISFFAHECSADEVALIQEVVGNEVD